MSLIECSECKNEISNKADSCPHCGNPLKQKSKQGCRPGCSSFLLIGLLLLVGLFFLGKSDTNTDTIRSSAPAEERVSETEIMFAQKQIQNKGYSCNKVDKVHPFILSRGYSVYCDGYSYHYEVADKGGNWEVTVD